MSNNKENIYILNYEKDEITRDKLNEILNKVIDYQYYGDIIWPSKFEHENEEIKDMIDKIENQLVI